MGSYLLGCPTSALPKVNELAKWAFTLVQGDLRAAPQPGAQALDAHAQ